MVFKPLYVSLTKLTNEYYILGNLIFRASTFIFDTVALLLLFFFFFKGTRGQKATCALVDKPKL